MKSLQAIAYNNVYLRKKFSPNSPFTFDGLSIGVQLCLENLTKEDGLGFSELDFLIVPACGLVNQNSRFRQVETANTYSVKVGGCALLLDGYSTFEGEIPSYSFVRKTSCGERIEAKNFGHD